MFVGVDELVQRVGRRACAVLELFGSRRGRPHTEHRDARLLPGVNGRGEHAGLAGTGRADDRGHRPRLSQQRHHRCGLPVIETRERSSVDSERTMRIVSG